MRHSRWIPAAIAIFTLAVSPPAAPASPAHPDTLQELTPGHQYEPGARVGSAVSGVSWVLPVDWLGALPADMPAFVLGSNTHAGIGMVYLAGGATVDRLVDMLKEPQQIGDGVVLTPVAPPVISGSRVTVTYTGEQYGGPALALVGPDGQSVVFCFAGPKEETAYYRKVIDELARSTVFTRPETSGIEKQWKDLLSGMMLRQMSGYTSGTSGGYTIEREWILCADGRYTFTDNSSASIYTDGAAGTGIGHKSEAGRWRLEMGGGQALLVLEPEGGESSRHPLQFDGRATFMDGERVYRVAGQGCP